MPHRSPVRPCSWLLAALLALGPSAGGLSLKELKVPTTIRAPGAGGAGKFAFIKTPASCLASPYETPGQGWHAGLSSGGVTRKATRYGAQPPTFSGLFGLAPHDVQTGPARVRVIVMDHFAPVEIRLKEGWTVETWPLRHGHLVITHLLTLLGDAGYLVAVDQRGRLQAKKGQSVITVEKLPLDGLQPPGVGGRPSERQLVSTDTLVTWLGRLENRDTGVSPGEATIYNMSFAVLSCEYLTRYRAVRRLSPPNRKYTFSQYLADTARANRISVKEVLRLVTELAPGNPFRRWLEEEVPRRGAVVVASSGNYGLPVQTWPAAAPTVMGVGASAWNFPARPTEWSDVGDTYSVGEWFRLGARELKRACRSWNVCVTDELKAAVLPARYSDFGYRGTSFAAPSVTAFLAMRLSASGAGQGCFRVARTGAAGTAAPGTGFVPVGKLDPASLSPPFAGPRINQSC